VEQVLLSTKKKGGKKKERKGEENGKGADPHIGSTKQYLNYNQEKFDVQSGERGER